MKCLLWKCWILTVALGLLMALGAFAEGTIGLASAAACTLGAVYLMRWSWAMEQRAERQPPCAAAKPILSPETPPSGLRSPPPAMLCRQLPDLFP